MLTLSLGFLSLTIIMWFIDHRARMLRKTKLVCERISSVLVRDGWFTSYSYDWSGGRWWVTFTASKGIGDAKAHIRFRAPGDNLPYDFEYNLLKVYEQVQAPDFKSVSIEVGRDGKMDVTPID